MARMITEKRKVDCNISVTKDFRVVSFLAKHIGILERFFWRIHDEGATMISVRAAADYQWLPGYCRQTGSRRSVLTAIFRNDSFRSTFHEDRGTPCQTKLWE